MKKLLVVFLLLAGAAFVPVGGADAPTYTVVRGDTLGKIAKAHGVSVSQLREWNGIRGDLIDVDQRLALAEGGPGVPLWELARDRLQALRPEEEVEVVQEEPNDPRSAKPRKRRARRAAPPQGQEPPSDLEEETVTYAPLTMPPPKRCLPADAGIEDGSFGRSVGLEAEQISPAVARFQESTFRCFEGRPDTSGEVLLDLVVGCDGRVIRSSVDSHSTGDGDFAVCVAEVFRYASFPAHARDEVEFSVPLRFTAVQ